jgi:hypothetical protein
MVMIGIIYNLALVKNNNINKLFWLIILYIYDK